MRLHEHLKSMTAKERIKFKQWQLDNNQEIYKLKKQIITERHNKAQQHLFEAAIVNLNIKGVTL